MRKQMAKIETETVLSDGRYLWGCVLIKGDTLYTYAYDIIEAYRNIFGDCEALAACVRCIMRMDKPEEQFDNLRKVNHDDGLLTA